MKKTSIHLPLAIMAALFLFSCGNDKPDTPWKRNDNTLRVRQSSAITTLNPLLYRSNNEHAAFDLVFQCPMNFDYEKLELVPQLITVPPMAQDITEGEYAGGQSFTYEIHADAVWDDGKPVTGKDYAFVFKALFNPKMPTQRFLPYIENVREVQVDEANPKRFTIFMNKKYFLNMEGISNLPVLPAHVYDPTGLMEKFSLKDLADPAKAAALANDPALQQFADFYNSPKIARETVSGSGPYQLVEWVDNQRVVLAKKQNWWGEKLANNYRLLQAFPDTIIFIPIEDQVATIAAIKDESVDLATEVDATQFMELRKVDFVQKIYNFLTPATYSIFYTAMQTRNPKLADKRVRRALAHSIDMDMVIKDLYSGLAERAVGPFSPEKKYYDKSLKPIAMNLDEARKLLAEAGWKDSNGNGIVDKTIDGKLTELKLQYLFTAGSPFGENYGLLLKSNAQKIGIEIEPVGLERKAQLDKIRNGDFELAANGAGGQPVPDDPKQFWHTDSAQPGGSNYSRFGNAESDAIIEGIQDATDEASRNKLYVQLQQLIYDEQPFIFLFSPQARTVLHQRFEPVVTRFGVSLQHLKLKE
ncbi:MAG: ABC transporter substrate-binding protein [Saprospiraceae bacterium]|nr:ABC transporter substrate-binding protein [Saprospiraceae bacterium]